MNQPNNVVPISADSFKQMAYSIIQIPGFKEGDEPISIQVKASGIMNMLANGRIPNTLMGKVTELFGDSTGVQKDHLPANMNNISDEQKTAALAKLNGSESGLTDMASLLKVFAEATMVTPKYADIKEFMTDAQLMAVFGAMYGEVAEAESFHSN